jgi:hypothetical protein
MISRVAVLCWMTAMLLTPMAPMQARADVRSDFANPPLRFRARPLWFWNNTNVTAAEVEAQLQGNRDKSGYGGLALLPFGAKFTPKYLSEEYFSLYGAAVMKARQLGMFLTLYDEYGFPSGSCGANNGDGIPRFKNKFPEATLRRLDKHEDTVTGPCPYSKPIPPGTLMSIVAMNTTTKERVDLTAKASGGSIYWSVPDGSWKIMTFVCVLDGDPNVDYLEPDSVAKFIGMVYQPYYDKFARDFGATIAGAFYDEPTLYIAYNTLPATVTADFRGLRYLTSPNQSNSDKRGKAPTLADDGPMQVLNPRDHHGCQHNVACAWPYFAESLYQATPDRGLAAMMYAPCTVTAQVGDGTKVKIEQATRYPFEERVELVLATSKSVAFPLYLRIPAWCRQAKVSINGQPQDVAMKGGSLVRIARTWANGDKIVLDLPMAITLTRWEKNKNSVSVNRGPLTYSIKIGEDYVRQYPDRKDDKWPALEIKPTTPWNYGLVIDGADPAAGIEVVKKEFPASGQPFALADAPVELKVLAKRIPNWTENYFGVVDRLQRVLSATTSWPVRVSRHPAAAPT